MDTVKDSSLFLPLEMENALLLTQRIVFVFSCFLHIPAMLCLLLVTPIQQTQIKPNLVLIQIAVIIWDIYESVLFEPVPVVEALMFYCKGLLCGIVPCPILLGSLVGVVAALGLTTFFCVLTRHRTMMPESNRLKMRKHSSYIIVLFFTVLFYAPTLSFTVFPFSPEESERRINESKYDVGWVRERTKGYFLFPDIAFLRAILGVAMACCIICFFAVMLPFLHMFNVLSKQTQRSMRTNAIVRQSLIRLFVQLIVPLLFLVTPAIVIIVQAELRCFPFMVAVIAVFCIPLHSIVHNLVLLFVMPTYRRAMRGAVIPKLKWYRNVAHATPYTSVVAPI